MTEPPKFDTTSESATTITTKNRKQESSTTETNPFDLSALSAGRCGDSGERRSLKELVSLVKHENFDPTLLSNEEIIELMLYRHVSVYKLESILGKSNAKRCVEVRRQYYTRELELLDRLDQSRDRMSESESNAQTIKLQSKLTSLSIAQQEPRSEIFKRPLTTDFEYDKVVGACCENVVGCVRLPVGLVGPLKLDNQMIYVPLATTEGCLVASASRGLSALATCGGVVSRLRKNRMTRAPIVRFQDLELYDAINNRNKALDWLEDPVNKDRIRTSFGSNSKHTNLIDYTLHPDGRQIHIRFEAETGDAMGMNMCSKGAEEALKELQRVFPTMDILTLSGNMCTDKKPSALNWICGRGKSVECNALLSADVVERVLKVSIDSLLQVWEKKVMVGSAMAGIIGGFNCHAANIVAAIFIATGQDAAQVVSSSNCLLTLEKEAKGSLAVHCSMPSIECGTVGGGTGLPDQSSYLQLMGIKGSTRYPSETEIWPLQDSDNNACKLARIICATVMATELSLLASLTEGTLVKSHMTHNRSAQPCKVV